MQIMPLVSLAATPSIGGILGSTGSKSFLDSINQELSRGSGVYFGSMADKYKDHYKSFVDNVVMPTISTAKIIKDTFSRVTDTNRIISINSLDLLEQGIPAAMQLPVVLYPPIKKLLKEEMIYGFEYEYDNIKDVEDVWGRLIDNGTAVLNGPDADEYMEWEWKSTDPIHVIEDIDNMEETRQFIDEFLEEHIGIDFTSYPNKIGKIK